MHRSGTSVIAHWLKECGLNIGDELYEASKFNPKGYFEDLDFLSLHKSLLEKNFIHSSGHEEIKDVVLSPSQIRQIENLIKLKNKNVQWGWKEPRTCLFLDYYKKILPQASFLIIHRNCEEVVSSLIQRELGLKKPRMNFFSQLKYKVEKQKYVNHYSKLWLYYNNILINQLKNREKVVFTSYKNLLLHDKLIFDRLQEWGFNLNYKPFNMLFDENLITQQKGLDIQPTLKLQEDIKHISKTLKKLEITRTSD